MRLDASLSEHILYRITVLHFDSFPKGSYQLVLPAAVGESHAAARAANIWHSQACWFRSFWWHVVEFHCDFNLISQMTNK